VRRRAAERLGFLGIAIDTHRNDTVHDDSNITADPATVQTLVITAREDLQIAREARQLLGPRQDHHTGTIFQSCPRETG
jgi:acetate kinase